MKRYIGVPDDRTETGGRRVDVEDDAGNSGPLPPRNDLYNHSPNGFEWGYGGSGPAQLALAILADHLATRPAETIALATMIGETYQDGASLADRCALRSHQDFKWHTVTKLATGQPFELTSDHVTRYVASRCAQ
jgi:uncharacterized protein (DUF2249 family)